MTRVSTNRTSHLSGRGIPPLLVNSSDWAASFPQRPALLARCRLHGWFSRRFCWLSIIALIYPLSLSLGCWSFQQFWRRLRPSIAPDLHLLISAGILGEGFYFSGFLVGI